MAASQLRTIWITLHTPNTRRQTVVNVGKIESMIEIRKDGFFDKNGVWVSEYSVTQIRMDSNDYGEVAETIKEIFDKIASVVNA